MNKIYKADVIAFIGIFVCLEIGASLIVRNYSYTGNDLHSINFERIDPQIVKRKVTRVINKPYNKEDDVDSVDVIKDYMDYYIFLPKEKENEERGVKGKTVSTNLDDKELLYRLVTREAGNQDTYGMRLIVDVVLNRVNDDRFPGNIKDVLYSPGQFDGAKDLSLITPYDTCKRAVDMELNCDLEGSRLDYESIYFARSPHTKNHYKHGDHYFSH